MDLFEKQGAKDELHDEERKRLETEHSQSPADLDKFLETCLQIAKVMGEWN